MSTLLAHLGLALDHGSPVPASARAPRNDRVTLPGKPHRFAYRSAQSARRPPPRVTLPPPATLAVLIASSPLPTPPPHHRAVSACPPLNPCFAALPSGPRPR